MTEKTKRAVIAAISSIICATLASTATWYFVQSKATANANANVQVLVDGKMVTVETQRLQEYYNNLSTKYDDLLSDFTTLQNDKKELSEQYNTLIENHNQLLLKYNDLQDRFTLSQKELNELKNTQTLLNDKNDGDKEPNPSSEQQMFLTDVVPAYQGARYYEYNESSGDGSSFSIAGKKYLDGCVWDCYHESFSLYSLDGKYKEIHGILGHVDGTAMDSTTMQIFLDGKLNKEVQLSGDMIADEYSIDVTGVNQLKIVLLKTYRDSQYGYGNIIIN